MTIIYANQTTGSAELITEVHGLLMDEIRQAGMAIARLEKAGEFEEAQQRIRDEANRKRAEAASAGMVGRAAAKAKEEPTLVVPQPEGQLNEPEPSPTAEPAQPIRDRNAERERETTTAKAKAIGTSRANVERA